LTPTPRANAAGVWTTLRRQVLPVLAWVLLALVLRWAVLEPRWIPSGSMLPTLQLQDRVLVEKLRARLKRPPSIGSVVVFHPPAALLAAGYDPKAALIKRVVAQAGDLVEVRDGVLWRNGTPAPLDWSAEAMNYAMAPLTVPPDHLLVLGDNRNASLDSHLWGPLPRGAVIGTAVLRYWPPERIGWLRFSAMGHPPGGAEELG
jgi:signal peptidase I